MSHATRLQIRWHQAMAEIDRSQWDRLAEPLETPLLEWRWLHQMEASGSISPPAGWHPRHLTVWKGRHMVGAAPLYIKTHSDGEFVYDQWWARWAREAGISYYPKLVGMSPVTPAVGYRFLFEAEAENDDVHKAMFAAIDDLCLKMGLSGCHLLFVDPQWMKTFDGVRFVPWQHQSFLWRNEGFTDFDDYLRPFKSSQRRNILRERQQMHKMRITIRALSHAEIEPDLSCLMYKYYLNTNAQYGPWAARFLNEDFFRGLFKDCRHRLLLIAAYHPSSPRPLALSLLLHKGDQLIGRYWGCAHPIKDLHFNMCYYAPIEWAIENGVRWFDPGAGSPHKIYRGFKAVANISLHRFYEPRLRLLFGRFIGGINQVEQANIEALNEKLPYAAVR
ncbi:MAG: GNAT family N-acetyltransferase [Desulfobacteraceae bacterium]|nr:MAG: GNAT family N-acetyltransferase [Desulfobacteraceae bacterium]